MNKNRYGDEWHWEKIATNQYKFHMSGDNMKYCRCGGKLSQSKIDMQDLGMFDPSGGPYISCRDGDEYPGTMIEGKEIIHIGHHGTYIEGNEIIRLAKVDEHFVATIEEKEDA